MQVKYINIPHAKIARQISICGVPRKLAGNQRILFQYNIILFIFFCCEQSFSLKYKYLYEKIKEIIAVHEITYAKTF